MQELEEYEESLDNAGYGRFQIMVLFLCGATLFADATELMLLPFLTYELDRLHKPQETVQLHMVANDVLTTVSTNSHPISRTSSSGMSLRNRKTNSSTSHTRDQILYNANVHDGQHTAKSNEATPKRFSRGHDTSLVSFWVFVGMLFGALFSGPISDVYGRRFGTILFGAIVAIAGISSVAATNFIQLVIFRCLTGFGVAGTPAALTLYAEVTPRTRRGRHLIYFMLFFSFGAVAEALLAWLVAGRGLQMLLAVSAMPAVLSFMATLLLLPESPRYLILRGRYLDARKAVETIALVNGTLERMKEYLGGLDMQRIRQKTVKSSCEESALSWKLPQKDLEIGDEKQEQHLLVPKSTTHTIEKPLPTNLSEALTAMYRTLSPVIQSTQLRRTTLILSIEFLLMAFVYYFLVMFTVKVKTLSGSKLSNSAYASVAISNLAEIPGLLVAMYLLDRIGRKATIRAMFLTCSCGTLLLAILSKGIFSNDIPNDSFLTLFCDGILFVMRASALGFNQSLWIFTTESFPTDVRASALGFTTSFARIGGAVSPYIVDHVFVAYPFVCMLLVAGVATAAGVLVSYVCARCHLLL